MLYVIYLELTSTYNATCTNTCPSGYTLSGSQCVRTYSATQNYYCSSGWSLSGSICTRTSTTSAIPGVAANSCSFSSYSSPPSPWRALSSSVSGSNTYYVFVNSNPNRKVTCPSVSAPATVPPDFTGASIQVDPQSLNIGGGTYTSGWKLTLTGYIFADAQVYCKKATP